ncbi:MAG: RNA polymerase sigma factor [Desulfobacteraceae bacterium]|nr:MAG: RNA polymerase sigma factor [Desulfobacteraceae bacterium]
MDEIELNQSLKQGQAAGFQALYESYGKKIYQLALRLSGNKEDAEDIVQETFLQVCRHIAEFDGRSRLYTWVYAIAKNIGCVLFFGKVRIDITKLKEFGEKLQAGALGPGFTKSTHCLQDDPTVGLNIWEVLDREDLEKKLKPHRAYYGIYSKKRSPISSGRL